MSGKNKFKIFNRSAALLLILLLLTAFATPALGATSSIQWWHMVDSGKHLDWGGSTKYQSDFNSSVSTWNSHKSGVIRKDSLVYIRDVTISDVYWSNGTVGLVNGDNKTMQFNTRLMDPMNSTRRKNACLHELGHALGLDHNQNGDVMYAFSSNAVSLTANDKASYNASYARY
ncbi:matrixin family metalloprotease [Methanimicrococcus blatticola]|uniref:Matrixin n=1 Tax=Methanimicrococcus blatticola TaxID=91560 RepID=A0A484F2I4_9EURY|nr:matrixin family metalloprotease [Methanimicrococcus blatticola]MBZ3935387.1 matrixin family metalloprotease [Methanimicrococcus blatticola]MCC2508515.1 matrixin family metalloprotease [Methanimicrococcus blatticola]TDQ67825.1 matrixin [Methanimicrococcus blatticola]